MHVVLTRGHFGHVHHRLTTRSKSPASGEDAHMKGVSVTRLFCCHRIVVHDAEAGIRCAHCGSKLDDHAAPAASNSRRRSWHRPQH
jgi:hypothetical protein